MDQLEARHQRLGDMELHRAFKTLRIPCVGVTQYRTLLTIRFLFLTCCGSTYQSDLMNLNTTVVNSQVLKGKTQEMNYYAYVVAHDETVMAVNYTTTTTTQHNIPQELQICFHREVEPCFLFKV